MKKCVLIIMSMLTIVMSVLTIVVSERRLAAKSLFLANVNALSQGETGKDESGIPLPGPEGWKRETCQANGGNWNMSTIVKEAKTVVTNCKVEGEVSILGVKIKGSYEKGNTYEMQITVYDCTASDTNCCIKIGSYYGNDKLS